MDDTAFTSRDLRDALSTFATGVTIITAADHHGEPVGMTASSFNSVSMEPPLILWSVTKSALSAETFRTAKHFAVHVLSSDQVGLSNRFASSGSDKFADTAYSKDTNGVPHIVGCASRLECSGWACYEGGDHWIIVGRVEKIQKENTEGLVFSGGTYATANPLRPATTSDRVSNDSDTGPIDNLLIYNLSRAYRQMADQFHDAVRNSGLTIPEWRILASLHGEMTHDLSELAARTFIDPVSLADMVQSMEEQGLCSTTAETPQVTGTPAGHERVEHLFALGAKQDIEAIKGAGDDARQQLVTLLQQVISNTN